MKKLLCFLLLPLLMAGCAQPGQSVAGMDTVIARPFEAEAEVSWKGVEYQAKMSRGQDGRLYLSLSSEHLGIPVEYILEGGSLSIGQGDLSLKLAKEEAPEGCAAVALDDALRALAGAEGKREGGEITLYDGKSKTELRLEEVNYQFRSLKLPDGTFTFTSFSFLDNAA